MTDAIYVISVLLSVIVLLSLKANSLVIVDGISGFPSRFLNSMSFSSASPILQNATTNKKDIEVQVSPSASNAIRGMFSIIIVTFNEVLLEKTYAVYSCLKTSVHNVLENTDPGYIYEVKLMVKGDK